MVNCGKCDNYKKYFKEILIRSLTDENFKRELLENPKKILKSYDVIVPDDVEVKVCENTSKVVHFILPTKQGLVNKEVTKHHWTSECFDLLFINLFGDKEHKSWEELQNDLSKVYEE